MESKSKENPLYQLSDNFRRKKCVGITPYGEFCNKNVEKGSKFCKECTKSMLIRNEIAIKRRQKRSE